MAELDPRKQTILRAVIIEYVSGAEPVASETLAHKYELGVKSATIRNELADITDLGYLEQPHTSAGRIPSDLGYRYYVDRLVVNRTLTTAAKQKVKDVTEDGEALQDLLRDTTKVLSRITHLLTAGTTHRSTDVSVRSAVVSAIGPQQALLVIMLSNGDVCNRLIECPPGLTLQELGEANASLAALLPGKTLRAISKVKVPTNSPNPGVNALFGNLWGPLKSIVKEKTRGTVVTSGEEFLFSQPEFRRDLASLVDMVDTLKESDVLFESAAALGEGPQKVTIGKEHRNERLYPLSVVRQSFYVGDAEAGTIAVIGPTRMSYDDSIPLVSLAARALSESLTRFMLGS